MKDEDTGGFTKKADEFNAYGRPVPSETQEEPEALALSEVSFRIDPARLRAIARFLEACAQDMERNGWGEFRPVHLRDEWLDWDEEYPDLIIFGPQYGSS